MTGWGGSEPPKNEPDWPGALAFALIALGFLLVTFTITGNWG